MHSESTANIQLAIEFHCAIVLVDNHFYIAQSKSEPFHIVNVPSWHAVQFFKDLFLLIARYSNPVIGYITFFGQDWPFDHWEDIVEVANNGTEDTRCQLKIGGYYGFHFNTITVPSPLGGTMWALSPSKQHGEGRVLVCQSNGYPQDSNPNINVDKYWELLFTDEKPSEYEFMPGGHFGITREHAQLRSKEFYKKVCDLLLEDESAPWMIERLECYIFNPNIK